MKQVVKRKKPRTKPPMKRVKTKELPKTTAIVPMPPVVPPKPTKEELTEKYILDAFDMLGIASKLDDRGKRLFIEVARMHQLNPLKREIHAVTMWDADAGKERLIPVTGYEVYIGRAEETGRLQYWYVSEKGTVKAGDYEATVNIKRKDWIREFSWTARYSENVRFKKSGEPNVFWKTKPTFMTQKVAIAQGFRLCFRDVLKGIPYTADEMREEIDITPRMAEPKAVETDNGHLAPRNETEEIDAEYEKALKLAKSEVQSMYATMVKSGLYDMEEDEKGHKSIPSLIDAATKAADGEQPIEALQKLLTGWQIEYAERKARAEKTDEVAEKGWKS